MTRMPSHRIISKSIKLLAVVVMFALLLTMYRGKSPKKFTYGLMIDAGSTGSRIHIYKFTTVGGSLKLISEVFEHTKPGLSSYAGKPDEAAESLDPLLYSAVKSVPTALHHCTPVMVRATAGLRLLKGTQADDILQAVDSYLRTKWPFYIAEKSTMPVAVMDGKDEAIYAWMTVNYLLDNLKSGKKSTAGILDLGGGSTQVVFQPNYHDQDLITSQEPTCKDMTDCGDFFEEKSLGSKDYVLYQHSYLGYGLMEARKQLKQNALKMVLQGQAQGVKIVTDPKLKAKLLKEAKSEKKKSDEVLVLSHPCLPEHHSEWLDIQEVDVKDHIKYVLLSGTDHSQSQFQSCSTLTEAIFEKKICQYSPSRCSFNGVFQPDFHQSFADLEGSQIFAFSYFYDRTRDILGIETDGQSKSDKWRVEDFKHLANLACTASVDQDSGKVQLASHLWSHFQSHTELHEHVKSYMSAPVVNVQAKKLPELCMDLTFMYHLLHTGYGLADRQTLKVRKKIDGVETGWCLGATIEMVDRHLRTDYGCEAAESN